MKRLAVAAAALCVTGAIAAGGQTTLAQGAPAPDSTDVAKEPSFDGFDQIPGQVAGHRINKFLLPADEAKSSGKTLASLSNGIIGVLGNPTDGYTVIVGSDYDQEAVEKELTAGLDETAQALISTKASPVTAADLSNAWAAVNDHSQSLQRSLGAYSIDIDAATSQVVIEASGQTVAKRSGDATRTETEVESLAPGLIDVQLGETTQRLVRSTPDAAPHYGGSWITWPNGTYCSSGFTVVRNGTTTRTSVTAGHCGGANGTEFTSGAYYYGDKAGLANYPDYDQARLQGSTYREFIRVGGGNDAQSLRSVRGATDPVIGDSLCQSGVTSYAECGIVVGSLSATLCDPAGCTTYLGAGRKETDAIAARGGDSGAPVYLRFSNAEAGIRGMLIGGGDGGRRMFFERYDSIANHLNVHIYTN
ncbi:hypothetical protein GCM10009795_005030 [Nocardioides hankookensis]|uniref:Streptogrisin C n=1 Tax=Nocardioides hankookensis TaxID=443157 RepID=A0ABW1LM48_9ACTN